MRFRKNDWHIPVFKYTHMYMKKIIAKWTDEENTPSSDQNNSASWMRRSRGVKNEAKRVKTSSSNDNPAERIHVQREDSDMETVRNDIAIVLNDVLRSPSVLNEVVQENHSGRKAKWNVYIKCGNAPKSNADETYWKSA